MRTGTSTSMLSSTVLISLLLFAWRTRPYPRRARPNERPGPGVRACPRVRMRVSPATAIDARRGERRWDISGNADDQEWLSADRRRTHAIDLKNLLGV